MADAYVQFVKDYIESKQIEKSEEVTIVYIVSPQQSKTLNEGCFPSLLSSTTKSSK